VIAKLGCVSEPAQRIDSLQNTHPITVGYVFWIIGFTGAHRFYYGRPLTGILWFFTGGLLLVGWLIDIVLIPSMAESANRRYPAGPYDYGIAWLLHIFLGIFGAHHSCRRHGQPLAGGRAAHHRMTASPFTLQTSCSAACNPSGIDPHLRCSLPVVSLRSPPANGCYRFAIANPGPALLAVIDQCDEN
jgi:TM2 domain-containing membrane protein YozV